MSSMSISPEALAEFIHLNCTREYGMEVMERLETALIQRDYTMQTIYEVIEVLNGLQPMLNKLQIVTYILDAVLAIGCIAAASAGYAGIAITGAHCVIKNNVCNRKIKLVQEAMMEDKTHRDSLEAVLRHQGLTLPFGGIEFKAEMNKIHEICLAIAKYVTGNRIDWIKHLEKIGIVGITPVVASPQQNSTAQPDQSKCSISDIFKMLIKAINYLQGFAGKRFQQAFLTIKAIVTLLCDCSNDDGECHPTAGLLVTRCVPELMHDAAIMQELLEKLVRNYKL